MAEDRDTLGRVVRNAWIGWARHQPNCKPSWLIPYEELPEADKEADRQIAEAVIDFIEGQHVNEDGTWVPIKPGNVDERARGQPDR